MTSDPTFLGTVEGVSGSTVSVVLRARTVLGIAFVHGEGYRLGQIGSFVRIPMGYVDLFGVVTSVGAGAVPENLAKVEPFGHRWLTVQLAGEATRKGDFQRGISQFPTVGDPVHLLIERDLVRIYGRPNDGTYLAIGQVASAESIPALVDVNRLVTRHSAILGATGSGKSTTVAALLHRLSNSERYPSARVLLLDIHGEYAEAFKGSASVFRINAHEERDEQNLFIPYWALTFDEFLEITLGDLNDADRGAVRQIVEDMKRLSLEATPLKGVTDDNLTVDAPVPFSVHKIWLDLHKLVYATYTAQGTAQDESTVAYELDDAGKPIEKGDAIKVIAPRYRSHTQAKGAEKIIQSQAGQTLNIRRPVDALASKLRDKRFDFLFRPGPWMPVENGKANSDIDALMQAWIGGTEPVTILDVSGIPSTVLTTLIGALLRIIYDCVFWARSISEGAENAHFLLCWRKHTPICRRRVVVEPPMLSKGLSKRDASTGLEQCSSASDHPNLTRPFFRSAAH